MLIFFPPTARPALVLAAVAGLAIWVIGENFGGILTGQGTDPNSGPPLVLLAAAYWPLRPKAARHRGQPARAGAPAAQLSGSQPVAVVSKHLGRQGPLAPAAVRCPSLRIGLPSSL
jgi:hypothetical protein